MSTATQPPRRDAAAVPRPQWWLFALALALLLPSLYFIWSYFKSSGIVVETVANRPLLKNDAKEFRDSEVGIRFSAPPRWGMQLRSTDAPDDDDPKDRMLVKYKRLLPNSPAAWFRVHVVAAPQDLAIEQFVKDYPSGHDWKPRGTVRSTTVGGRPAAEMRYGGAYHGFPSYRDIVAVRQGSQVFVFVSTYQVADSAAQQEARQSMNTVLFDSR